MKRSVPLARRTRLDARQGFRDRQPRPTPTDATPEPAEGRRTWLRAFRCRSCGATFHRSVAMVAAHGEPTFCSPRCSGIARVRDGATRDRGTGWKARAAAIRDRDGHRCVRCDAPETTKAHHVDHVIPWVMLRDHQDVANQPENMATLCQECHGYKTAYVEPRLLKGDMMALRAFYGPERETAARALLNMAGAT